MLSLKRKLLTVMSVTDGHLMVVQGSDSKVVFSKSLDIDWSDEQKAGEILAALLPITRRRQMKNLCLVLPRQMFFWKLIHLPSIDEQELRKMASLQIAQHLPYPEEQAVWDILIGDRRGTISDIMILAVQREVVMKYLRILSRVDLSPVAVTISSYILSEFLSANKTLTHTAVFSLEENSSEFCFCNEGKFYFSRSIAYGAKDFAGDNIGDFLKQVRLTFKVHRKNFLQASVFEGVCMTYLADNFPPGFLEQLTVVSGVSWKELPPQKEEFLLSSLLRRDFRDFSNFLPKDLKEWHSNKAGQKKAVTLLLLVLGVMLSVTLAVSAPVIKKLIQYRKITQELSNIEGPFLRLRVEKELLATIEHRWKERIVPLTLLEELYHAAPSGISFLRVQVNSQSELNLEGQALQSALVNELQEKMNAGVFFHDVRLEHAIRRTTAIGEVVHFVITAKLQQTLILENEK